MRRYVPHLGTAGIEVSDADCYTVGPGFESRRRHGFCKCVVPLRHEGILNSCGAQSLFVRLVEGEESWEVPDHLPGILQNWGGTEPNRTVTCMELKAKANDKCTSSPLAR
ncbi:hypothetical protein TNCV_5135871 [Trichonephila clavipes]|nr:hypothetical protein TNCV_5135871 [Trichonephila clavipes]